MVHEVAASLAVGLLSGIASGLLGVSPGGGLVVFSALLLGVGQHVAQGVSLIAQVPPTSLAGVRRYREKGGRASKRWLVLLTIGFLFGGVVGALAAASVSGSVLRWVYVAYLAALDALMILRAARARSGDADREDARISSTALLAVGLAGGISSGFLGIGGGLAITVGLGAALKAPQHQAQLVSLILSVVPTTLPAAFVYWRAGWTAPWPIVAIMILGLWGGTDIGARLANRIGETILRRLAIGFVSAMAIAMALKAIG
jgi:uncharacterized membrane protein YfcA